MRTSREVTVIGGGVVGYTCAHRLARAGHEVTVITADPPGRTTSAVAAAVWFPYEAGPADAVLRWGAESLRAFTALAADPRTGVSLRRGLVLHRTPEPDLWWTAAVPAAETVVDGLPAGVVSATRCTLPVIDMGRYLGWLVAEAGVRTVVGEVRDLAEVPGPVVVAAGLRSGGLVGDDGLVPVRGQVVRVANPGLTDWLIDDDNPAGLTYVVPRASDVVCGGTAERGERSVEPSPAVEGAILDRVRALVPALRGAPVLSRAVGLRPARPVVRLDRVVEGGRAVVSCYGHGGAGVTLSWGCAADVVALLEV
ncbi:NAD(P)/FAD-dependent oxidoreductase [Saccharothrix syringae]|uniref:D-amino-acid oxidase n=1 Tax=Saccharothrix syringae TaxID=103733 RepID=A0A5Q0H1P1_SACSY|nr:FAD-dependent oxidoreductase [Saccharothrix syringae]QFZ20176.1 FAD-binding oxidoreductase [Saccharothrix syringae]